MAFLLPDIVVHEIKSGNVLNGGAPNGTLVPLEKGAPTFNGRYRLYEDGTTGGLIEVSPQGGTLVRVSWTGDGTATITGHLVSPDGFEHLILDGTKLSETVDPSSTPAGFSWAPIGTLLVPPGFKLKFVSTNNLTSAGRLMVHLGSGWGVRAFENQDLS